MPRASSLIVGMVLIVAGPASAQTATALTKPDAEFAEPFTRVASIRELPGGRVLVSDSRDKIVQLLDFKTQTTTKVGREGEGPGEYSLPAALFPLPGNQTWLYDLLGRRFLPIDQNGAVADPVPLPGASGAGGRGMLMMGGAQGFDAQGRIYFQAPPLDPTHPSESPDSLAILRWDRVHPAMDTVAWIVGPKAQVTTTGGGRRFSMRIGGGKVFEPEEAWGVAGTGAVARVIPAPYHVVWYPTGGAAAAGPVVPYQALPVTQADKDEVIAARKRGGGGTFVAMSRNGGRVTTPQKIELPDPEFADTKPPFLGQSAVLVSPEGEVWVQRTQKFGERNPVYDVFDRAGRLARKVTLQPRSRVVGFGSGTVYVVRQDEDDLEYLQRFGAGRS